jgi:hypothetical protein
MPISLPPLSRRHFLAGSAALLAAGRSLAEEAPKADPHRFVLMADTHIPNAPDVMRETTNMHDNLVSVAKSILALEERPSAALLLGDCAYLDGKADDYALLVKILEPLRKSGLPIHLLLGNHDHRERFWKALPEDEARDKDLDGKHVMSVKSPRANFFLLDSLDVSI